MARADGVLKDALSARDVQRNFVLFIFTAINDRQCSMTLPVWSRTGAQGQPKPTFTITKVTIKMVNGVINIPEQ